MSRTWTSRALFGSYGALAGAAAPLLRLMLRRRVAAGREIAARLAERRGEDSTPRPPGPLIWLHAASVGETMSVLPVLSALVAQTRDVTVLMTTGTVTSARMLAARLPALGLEGRVLHRFVPLDVPAWVARFLDHWQPDVAGFVESEIWPALLEGCRVRGIPAMLVNARLSARSFARWRSVPGVARALFGGFARVHAQTEEDAERLAALGAPAAAAQGNLKYAASPLPCDLGELARLRFRLAGRPVWLAASTHPGEEEAIGRIHATLARTHPGLLTVLVPRHPERGAELADLLGADRRAAGRDPPEGAGLWIADTLGELGLLYRLAPVVFMGGSLVAKGGQNPLEPARLGCAVAIGPHAFNFREPVGVLAQAGALARVEDEAGLLAWADALLRDPARIAAIGQAGMEAASRDADLPDRVAASLLMLAGRR
jgi:3-deoxy-D-manno-octulosonic-acid transferase